MSYQADPNYEPLPTDVGPTGRGNMNMGTGRGRGGAGGGAAPALPAAVQAATTVVGGNAPAVAAPAAPPAPLATIGPDGPAGSVLYAWDPIAKKERWRAAGAAAGPFAGGSLATAGNLVFSSVNDRLMFFRADTGEKLGELAAGTTQMGPPMTFLIDGKQYIAVSGGPQGGGGRGAAGGTPPAPQPAHVLFYALDGKAPLPGAPRN